MHRLSAYFVALSLLFASAAWAEKSIPPLPANAKVERTSTTTSIFFKDGSSFYQGPTDTNVEGPKAIRWFLSTLRVNEPLFEVFDPKDVKSFKGDPVGGKMTFTDGSMITVGAVDSSITGGMAGHYNNLMNKKYEELKAQGKLHDPDESD
ncbi:MAG: hypothetical protein ACKVOE_00945 [Rickettsiales bacterium]